MFHNIPDVLKELPNFVLWRYEERDGSGTKVCYNPHTGHKARNNDPLTWGSFEKCVEILPATGMNGIGFVITPGCNLTCIDIDDPFKLKSDGTPKYNNAQELFEQQVKIAESFNTYQEISPSGKGLHIWVEGSVPSGRDRYSVGLYPSGRYMTMTGNVYNSSPINPYPELLHQLWVELGGTTTSELSTLNIEQTQNDEDILIRASGAVNGLKFIDLWEGNWQKYYNDDPSKVSCNEADYALIDILAFYTQNRSQLIRMFRNSALGRRKKALRDKYVDDMISKSFDHQAPEIDLSAMKANLDAQFQAIKQAAAVKQAAVIEAKAKPIEITEAPEDFKPLTSIYTPPPGLIGEIAYYIYKASPRPVPEISLAAAIGLMSGVCGRAYNISGTGLNQYTLLLAKTGTGKEAISSGISKMISSLTETVKDSALFIGPSKIASQEALIKYMAKNSNSFVSVMGEFADTLKKMSNASYNLAQQGVKDIMLDLYNKSGNQSQLGGLIYSQQDKNTAALKAPAFSIIGECVPEKFYELCTEAMVAEGFLSRFNIIEYQGLRVPSNKNHGEAVMSRNLLDAFSMLVAYSIQLNGADKVIQVQLGERSQSMLDEFDRICDKRINEGNGPVRELWNRAHIKALKLAGLLAVGTNYTAPIVRADQAMWAINFVETNINTLLSKFDTGEVGVVQNQNKQLLDLKKAFKFYLSEPWTKVKSYAGSTEPSYQHRVVPHSFLSSYCRQRISFKEDRLGPIQALKTLLLSLIESGEIQELAVSQKGACGIGKNGKAYIIEEVKGFL